MNSNKYDNLLQKYYDGLTTVAEERWLKAHAQPGAGELPLVSLCEESPVMDWSFEDFKEEVNQPELRQNNRLFSSIKWISYAAAAVLLVSLSTWLYMKANNTKAGNNELAKLPAIVAPGSDNILQGKNNSPAIKDSSYPQPVKIVQGATAKTNPVKANKKRTINNSHTRQKNDDFFVMVNGIRITNENEALGILQQSLVTLSGNVTQTMNGINNSPKLDIKFK